MPPVRAADGTAARIARSCALPQPARLTPLSAHFRRQLDRPAGNHEGPPPEMMNRPRIFPRAVDPRFQHFENEETVFGRQFGVDDLAFERRIAFVDRRRLDARGSRRSTNAM